ncbi:hypothetical protein AKJ49_01840 [candidate division MSBL1 archaeon SCGC-AAA382A03]|uniref:Probable RNA 2'-phosphotransferase n=1 Tax=candidate division MSBL1 archaeon SCGC-AAA382A03 TaxID=1698278 RepID=A0A133VDX8_9EURY|nr:hypothetical protein AKJ49_01840 [candidate division MSBL1 archaeon SCGC-AAA382A03]
MKDRTKASKQIAYLLRHNPVGMKISKEGFVNLNELLEKLQERWTSLSKKDIRELVETDPKGRYEIKNQKIRARYGHSINVNPTLEKAQEGTLYHGTTSKAAQKILEEGLKSKGRQKVHLSNSVEDAIEVGKRRTDDPVILEIDVGTASKAGVNIERASDKVYVSDNIPSQFISMKRKKSNLTRNH